MPVETTVFPGNLHVTGALTAHAREALPGALDADDIETGAGIGYLKLVPKTAVRYWQASGSGVAAATADVHIAAAAGTVLAVEAAVTTVATGTDRTVTVDLHKGNAADTFATVLDSTIVFDDDSTVRAVSSAVIGTASYADGDILRVVVTVAGSDGNQAQGLVVIVWLAENPR